MAEVTVTERTRRQGARIAELRLASGPSKPLLAARLGFGSTQTYDLYERGVSVIRLDRVTEWAEAFGLSEDAFLSVVLGRMPVEDAGWSFREALRGHIADDEIEALAAEWEGRGILDQKAAAASILRLAGRNQHEPEAKPKRVNRPA